VEYADTERPNVSAVRIITIITEYLWRNECRRTYDPFRGIRRSRIAFSPNERNAKVRNLNCPVCGFQQVLWLHVHVRDSCYVVQIIESLNDISGIL